MTCLKVVISTANPVCCHNQFTTDASRRCRRLYETGFTFSRGWTMQNPNLLWLVNKTFHFWQPCVDDNSHLSKLWQRVTSGWVNSSLSAQSDFWSFGSETGFCLIGPFVCGWSCERAQAKPTSNGHVNLDVTASWRYVTHVKYSRREINYEFNKPRKDLHQVMLPMHVMTDDKDMRRLGKINQWWL